MTEPMTHIPKQAIEAVAHNFEMEIATVENENGSVNGDDVRRLLSHAYACGATTALAEATLAEKEACAKVAESMHALELDDRHDYGVMCETANNIAAAIRGRKP